MFYLVPGWEEPMESVAGDRVVFPGANGTMVDAKDKGL